MTDPTGGGFKLKAFISYSRADIEFVGRLERELRGRGIEALVDRTEIHAFEDWWLRIEKLITAADAVVFVLSPDAVASDVCQKEVAFARSLNKRLAPIVYRRVVDAAVPADLARLNFIFFDESSQFDASVGRLAGALTTDIEWVRKHTEYGQSARAWTTAKQPTWMLLRPPLLEAAERWIASRPGDAPEVADDTREFIITSRRAATRRRNMLTAGFGAAAVLALGLSGLALWQRTEALNNLDSALKSESQYRAFQSARARQDGDAATAALLALEALPDKEADERLQRTRPYVPEAEIQLDAALRVLRERRIFKHSNWVESAVYSRDGRRILTATEGDTAHIWDAATGAELQRFVGHRDGVRDAQFSADEKLVLTTSRDRTVRVWDATTGKQAVKLLGEDDNEVDTATSEGGRRWVSMEHDITAAFTADGRRVITESDGTIRIFTVAEGKLVVKLGSEKDKVGYWMSPDHRWMLTLSASEPLTAKIRDSANAKTITELKVDWTGRAVFSADGRQIAIGHTDKSIRVMDIAGGNEIARLADHGRMTFSPDGRRILTIEDDARVWDVASRKEIARFAIPDNDIWGGKFSPDGKLVAIISRDLAVTIFDVASREVMARLKGHQAHINGLAFSPDGTKLLTYSADHTARIWQVRQLIEPVVLSGHNDEVTSVVFTADGQRLVTASLDKTFRIWDAAAGREVKKVTVDTELKRLAMSPDGRSLAASDAIAITHVLDVTTGKETSGIASEADVLLAIDRRKRGFADIFPLAFSPDGTKLATSHADRSIQVWDQSTKKEISAFTKHAEALDNSEDGRALCSSVGSVQFSPDGKHVLSASLDAIRLWDAATGVEARAIPLKRGEGTLSATFAPSGTHIVTGGNPCSTSQSREYSSEIYDLSSGKVLATMVGHTNRIEATTFSPDGRRIASASQDKTARIWDAASGDEVIRLEGHTAALRAVAYRPDGSQVATASADRTVRIWPVTRSTQELVDRVKELVPRCLSESQRDEFNITRGEAGWCKTIRGEARQTWALLKDKTYVRARDKVRDQGAMEPERDATLKAAGEARKAAEIETAPLEPDKAKVASSPGATVPAPPDAAPVYREALARALQAELRRVGCDPGAVDGNWDTRSAEALRQFARLAKVPASVEQPTEDGLAAVRGHKGRVCPLQCDDGMVERNGECVGNRKRENGVARQVKTSPTPPKTKALTRELPKGATESERQQYSKGVPCFNLCIARKQSPGFCSNWCDKRGL